MWPPWVANMPESEEPGKFIELRTRQSSLPEQPRWMKAGFSRTSAQTTSSVGRAVKTVPKSGSLFAQIRSELFSMKAKTPKSVPAGRAPKM